MRQLKLVIGLVIALVALGACGGQSATPPVASATSAGTAAQSGAAFVLSSPAVADGGALPVEFTCDGARATLPLAWSGAPLGTQSFAVVMHHVPGSGDTHWYWVVYDLPASLQGLPKNGGAAGTLGSNSVNGKAEYAPPCSKGPGLKTYTYTVYALSSAPALSVPASAVSRDVLLAAIGDRTLASAALNVTYTR